MVCVCVLYRVYGVCLCVSADCMVCVCVLYRVVGATVYLLVGRDATSHTYTGGGGWMVWYGIL